MGDQFQSKSIRSEVYSLSLTPVSLNVTSRPCLRSDIRKISCDLRQQLSFMLNRTEITQTRMQTLAIVKPINIVIQSIAHLTPTNLLVRHWQLAFDRFKHRFHRRVVITVADAAHRTRNAMMFAPCPIQLAGILTVAVGIMDHSCTILYSLISVLRFRDHSF